MKDQTPVVSYEHKRLFLTSCGAEQDQDVVSFREQHCDFLWFPVYSFFLFENEVICFKLHRVILTDLNPRLVKKEEEEEEKKLPQNTDDRLCIKHFLQYFCTSVTPCILMSYFKLGCCCWRVSLLGRMAQETLPACSGAD